MFIECDMFNTSKSGNIWHVLKVSIPLILASASHSINLFTDRLMLRYYSEDAMQAAFPAGLTSFALMCYFVGTVGYTGAFVAQYSGAKMYSRVGKTIWQAVYIAVIGGIFSVCTVFFAEPIFHLFGHAEHLRPLEIKYFSILGYGGIFPLLSTALIAFWGGQGKTNSVLLFNLMITACNIPLNYLFIFGFDFSVIHIPCGGVVGAAYATNAASGIGSLIMLLCILTSKNRTRCKTTDISFDRDIFCRIFKFGGPNGIQLFLDLASFNAFVVLLGRIGPSVLDASGVAFSLNSLAMIPMFGLGQTVSILVGQGIGAKDIPYAERSVRSARFWLYLVLVVVGYFFLFHPGFFLRLFHLTPEQESYSLAVYMLRFITAYLLFDATSILYGSAVKGAGDTKFSMWIGAIYAWALYGFPCLGVYLFFSGKYAAGKWGSVLANQYNLWTLWTICVAYIMILGVTYYLRYRSGKWKSMQVIEEHT